MNGVQLPPLMVDGWKAHLPGPGGRRGVARGTRHQMERHTTRVGPRAERRRGRATKGSRNGGRSLEKS